MPVPWKVHNAAIARAVRAGNHDAADAARREMRAARLADQIRAVMTQAPPLTAEQLTRLRALFEVLADAR